MMLAFGSLVVIVGTSLVFSPGTDAAIPRFDWCLQNITFCYAKNRRCTCKILEMCPRVAFAPPYNSLAECQQDLPRLFPNYCGKLYFGCSRYIVKFPGGSYPQCECRWKKSCINEQQYDTLAQCEADLPLYLQYASKPCPKTAAASQLHPKHRCSQTWKNFCEIGSVCDRSKCCFSDYGCNPNPFLWATTEKCHLPFPRDLLENPCNGITCKEGFRCVANRSLCRGEDCSTFNPLHNITAYCVIDLSYDPCKHRRCSRGMMCKAARARCIDPPCAVASVCVPDPEFNPCEENPCDSGYLCSTRKCGETESCIKEALCEKDPNAKSPSIITILPPRHEALVGESVEFVCKAEAIPPLTAFEWFHDSVLVASTDENVKLTLTKNETRLQIQNVTISTAGSYLCKATNPIGSSSQTTELIVYQGCGLCAVDMTDERVEDSLCGDPIAVQGRVFNRTARTHAGFWDVYRVNVSRIYVQTTSRTVMALDGLDSLRIGQVIEAKVAAGCPCQRMEIDRHYLLGLDVNSSPEDGKYDVFPNGIVIQWSSARQLKILRNDGAKCSWSRARRVSAESVDLPTRSTPKKK
ncbi:uncharacterized protein [Oscarella lobularis]|uniref:uncharacterized protein n=1 Tax=Oscarella lobularis TaxID=121494 RepID=UPI0033138A22